MSLAWLGVRQGGHAASLAAREKTNTLRPMGSFEVNPQTEVILRHRKRRTVDNLAQGGLLEANVLYILPCFVKRPGMLPASLWWHYINPDSKIHGANMGSIWGRKVPSGPHVGPMTFAIWVKPVNLVNITYILQLIYHIYIYCYWYKTFIYIVIDTNSVICLNDDMRGKIFEYFLFISPVLDYMHYISYIFENRFT